MPDTTGLPTFKYHPHLYEGDEVSFQHGVCECCGQEVDAYIDLMYCREDVNCICLNCVASGAAAAKFHGDFVQDAEPGVTDPEKIKELFQRTPGYCSWQGEHWLTCCDDFCAYLGTVGTKELEVKGIADAVIDEYEARDEYADIRDVLVKDGALCGYLFQCLHCGAHHLWVDAD